MATTIDTAKMREIGEQITRETTDIADRFKHALQLMKDNQDAIWMGSASDIFLTTLQEICQSGCEHAETTGGHVKYLEEHAEKYDYGDKMASQIAEQIMPAVWADV